MSDDSTQAILAALGTTLGRLEAGQARLEAGQVKLEAGQTKLEDGQARLESGMATLATRDELMQVRTDIMARMDTHANELRAIHDSIATNYGASEHAVRLNSNTRKEAGDTREEVQSLTKMIFDMRRELARLQTDVRDLKGPL